MASDWEQRRGRLTRDFAQTQAMNLFANQGKVRHFDRSFQDLTKQYAAAVPQLTGAFGKRGLAGPNVRSGIQRQALQDFASQRAQSFGDLRFDVDRSNDLFKFGQKSDFEDFNQSITDLEFDKNQQMSADAQALLRFRYGG